MTEILLLAGFGGQGVQALGKALAYAGGLQGLHVTMDAQYSGNMRGSPSNCTVIISDRPIGSPREHCANRLVVFSQLALDKLVERVTQGGSVFYNSTLAAPPQELRQDLSFLPCPATELAEQIGDPRCANSVMAGFLSTQLTYLAREKLREGLRYALGAKPALLEINLRAFDAGAGSSAIP